MTKIGWKKYSAYGAFLLLVQLAAACGTSNESENQAQPAPNSVSANAAEPPAEAVENAHLVVAFGDSLFAGYQLRGNEGLAPVLERKLAELGKPARVFNAGVSGDTSAAGMRRLAYVLDGLPKKPDLVIVGLGSNDMLRGLKADDTRRNLTAILDELDRRDIDALLAGAVAAPNMGRDYAEAFNPIYPDLAKRYGLPFYPFILDGVIGNEELLLPDGMHPNPQGVERIVAGIGPVVAKALGD